MAQGYAALRGGPEPFRVIRGGSPTAAVVTTAPIAVYWSGAADPAWPAGAQAVSAYGGTSADATKFDWLLCARQGTAHPILVKEQDYPLNMDSVVGGTWARLRKLEGSSLWPVPQT